MASFAKGFESTFKSGLAIGSSAAEKSIAEKIKKQAETVKKETDSLQAQTDFENIRKAIGTSKPDVAAGIAELDYKAMGTENLNKITQLLSTQMTKPTDAADKTVSPEQVQKLIQENPGLNISGKTPEGMTVSGKAPNLQNITTEEVLKANIKDAFKQKEEGREASLAADKTVAVKKAEQEFNIADKTFSSAMTDINSTIDNIKKNPQGKSINEINEIKNVLVNQAKLDSFGSVQDPSQPSLTGVQAFENKQALDFLNTPVPKELTAKQQDMQDTMDHGMKILDMTEEMYNDISTKYGTGRLKGMATTFQGKMGDLMPFFGGKEAPEVVPYLNNLEGLANFIGRSIYRDDRVSDVNIKGYKKALADLTNTPAEAKIMFNILRRYADNPQDLQAEKAIRTLIPLSGESSKNNNPIIVAHQNGLISREEMEAIAREQIASKKKV